MFYETNNYEQQRYLTILIFAYKENELFLEIMNEVL